VHNFGTCKRNASVVVVVVSLLIQLNSPAQAVQCRLPNKKRVWPQNLSEVDTAQPQSFGKLCMCTDLDRTLLCNLILRTCTKFVWKHKMPALGVCFLQPCSSAGCRFATSTSRLQYYRQNVSFPQKKKLMKCVVNWIPLRIHVRSRNTPP